MEHVRRRRARVGNQQRVTARGKQKLRAQNKVHPLNSKREAQDITNLKLHRRPQQRNGRVVILLRLRDVGRGGSQGKVIEVGHHSDPSPCL